MKKNIFINATSATEGGSLTILKQFLDGIRKYKESNQIYYIFVSSNCLFEENKDIKLITIQGKKYKDRIIWDLFGMKNWSKLHNIFPDLIISLQNTAVKFGRVPQIVYLHTPLPYEKEINWSLFRKDEQKLWFYKNIYKIWIDWTISKKHYIIVQTNWMKKALELEGYYSENVLVSRPNIPYIDINEIPLLTKVEGKKYLFYPAANYKYKNHMIIINALIEIRKKNPYSLKNILIIFTLDKNSRIYTEVVKNKLEDIVVFTGKLEYKEVLKYYKSCDLLLFPSYIETFGLPLIEGMYFNKMIYVSDRNYSREVIKEYELSKFIKFDDVHEWENAIQEFIVNSDLCIEQKHSSTSIKKMTEYNGNEAIFDLIKKICDKEN